MNQIRTVISLLLGMVLAVLMTNIAWAVPSQPHTAFGPVLVNGVNVPDGTQVSAEINGVEYVRGGTFTADGQSVYKIDVPGDDTDTTDTIEGGKVGDTIVFKVNGQIAEQTASWTTLPSPVLTLTVNLLPSIASVSPNSAAQDTSFVVNLTGINTSWASSTTVDFGSDITTGSVHVIDSTHLSSTITIAADAIPGSRTITVTTGAEVITETNGFIVQGPGIDVDIPDDLVGSPGRRVNVPVYILSNVIDRNVSSAEFTVTFDPILIPRGIVKAGTMTEDWIFVVNNQPGEISVAGYGTSPLIGSDSGSDILLYLAFDVAGEIGDETDLTFSDFLFNEGDPAAQTQDGDFIIVTEPVTLSGNCRYAHSFVPIPDCGISLTGTENVTATTDASGHYSATVEPGDYTAVASKIGDVGNVFRAQDGRYILEYAAGARIFDALQLRACDVSGDGNCTAFDAREIARDFLGLPLDPDTRLLGQWDCDPSSRAYSSLDSGMRHTSENYVCHIIGDVTFDWPEPNLGVRAAQSSAIIVKIPSTQATSEGTMTIPVEIQNVIGKGLKAWELFISFDPEILTIESVEQGNVVPDDWVFMENLLNEEGEARMIGFGIDALSSDGILLNLTVSSKGNVGDETALTISHLFFNDGQPMAQGVDGQLQIIDYSIFMPLILQ